MEAEQFCEEYSLTRCGGVVDAIITGKENKIKDLPLVMYVWVNILGEHPEMRFRMKDISFGSALYRVLI